MSKLTFEEFSKANDARKKQFFKGASVNDWSVSDCMMAAMGELGEIANALKKVRRAELGMLNNNKPGRQVNDLKEARAQVAGEIGGFMCYLDQLCGMLGLRLEDCIVDEFNKKSKELDLPERLIDGKFMLATTGTFRVINEVYREFDGEMLYEPPKEDRTIHMTIDDMDAADVYSAVIGELDKPDRPTTWDDGCGKCHWCAMDMDMDPYCTNPEIKKAAGGSVGLNAALQTCTVAGKLSLFEPRN